MRSFFGLDDDFVRELPSGWWRADVAVAGLLVALSIVQLVAWKEIPSVRDLIEPDIELVGEDSTGQAAIAAALNMAPDVVLMNAEPELLLDRP